MKLNLPNARVLIVDDERDIIQVLEMILNRMHYQNIRSTTDSRQVLALFQDFRPDIVLLDLMMPYKDGFEIMRELRGTVGPDEFVPILVLTGETEETVRRRALTQGATDFLLKPPNSVEVFLRFNNLLETRALYLELNRRSRSLEAQVQERFQEIVGLQRDQEKSLLGTAQILAQIAEMHSPVLGKHSQRVAELAREVGQWCGLKDRDLFELELAARLHDLGKLGVPREVLDQPVVALGPEELALYRRHPVKGENLLQAVPHLGQAPKFILHHHERVDGKGFPVGLTGEEIPIGAKIIAAVDAFDNLLNARHGYASTTEDHALAEVQRRAAEEFDLEIVSAMTRCIRQRQQAEKFAEVEILISDLREGMVLARDLHTIKGVLIVAANTGIDCGHLERITNFQETNQVVDSLYVYRKKPAKRMSPQPT